MKNKSNGQSATLYVVATPIGNLQDITLRAVQVLKEADFILCEDTRVTKKLLNAFDITAPTMSYHARSGKAKEEKIITLLTKHRNVALVSDAGTPTISDPGSRLVSIIRERLGDNVRIVAVPGPSAVTAALSISGLPASEFLFLGFLPHKKGRETLLREAALSKRTVVLYESPHRIVKTLEKLADLLEVSHKVIVVREMTKIYEEIWSGSAQKVYEYALNHPGLQRGEFVIMIH